MPKKKECRYNPKHKFNTEDEQLNHESKCPDKEKRTDLKLCPFTNRHILKISQFNSHIKKCKYKPKDYGLQTQKNEKNQDNGFNFDNLVDWGEDNETRKDEENDGAKTEKKFNFDFKDINKNVFDEDDFIFQQCYV